MKFTLVQNVCLILTRSNQMATLAIGHMSPIFDKPKVTLALASFSVQWSKYPKTKSKKIPHSQNKCVDLNELKFMCSTHWWNEMQLQPTLWIWSSIHNQNVEWNIAAWILLFVALCMHECTLYDDILFYFIHLLHIVQHIFETFCTTCIHIHTMELN